MNACTSGWKRIQPDHLPGGADRGFAAVALLGQPGGMLNRPVLRKGGAMKPNSNQGNHQQAPGMALLDHISEDVLPF